MDAALIGSWLIDSTRTVGGDEFNKLMGYDGAQQDEVSKMKQSVGIAQDGDVYKLTMDAGDDGYKSTLEAKYGETVPYTAWNGDKCTMTPKLDGGSLVEYYEIPEKKLKWTVKRTASADKLTCVFVATIGDTIMKQFTHRK